MSYYVKRVREDREGWVGPIRSERQAGKEVDAWADAGWDAAVFPSTPETRKAVRDWQRKVNASR